MTRSQDWKRLADYLSRQSRQSEFRLNCLDYSSEMRVGLRDLNALPHDRTRPWNVTCVPLSAATVRCRAVRVYSNGIEREPGCRRPPGDFNAFSIRSAFFGC